MNQKPDYFCFNESEARRTFEYNCTKSQGECLIMNNYWHSYNSNCGFMTTAAFGDYHAAQANTLKKNP